MKIGKLQFKDYAAKKPLSISVTGKYLSAVDLAKQPARALGSGFALRREQQIGLVLERYRLEPDFRLGVIGVGILSKAEIVEHIKAQTDFGKEAVAAEIAYCNELAAALKLNVLPTWPKLPKPKIPDIPDWKPVKKCIYLKLKNQALFCENTTDSITSSFAAYRIANVHPAFTARGFVVTALTGSDDVRVNFVTQAKKPLTKYIGGIGHGAYTLYTGHMGNHILEVGGYDAAEVKDHGFHFLSCQTGKTLGPDTVANGADFYAGYDENFTFVWDDSSTPVDEVLLFKQADSTFDLTIANGGTAQQAYDNTVAAFNAAIASVPGTAAATWLTWDRTHLRLHGDGSAVVNPYRYVKICLPLLSIDKMHALAMAGELEK